MAGAALLTASVATTGFSDGRSTYKSAEQSYISPLPPIAPRSQKECDALDASWQRIRQSVAAEHSACLDSTKDQHCPSDSVTGCTCVTCAPYHDSSSLGSEDVEACRATVREYERQQAAAERLAREREEEARRRQEFDREQAQAAARHREDELRRQTLEENRRRDEAQRREAREQKAWQDAAKASAVHQEIYNRLRALREQERAQVVAAQGDALNKFEQVLSGAKDAARRWQDNFAAALKDKTESAAATSPQSNIGDFDLSSASKDPASRLVDGLTTLAKSLVPFASIPIAILDNSYHASVAAIDELGYALEHFDQVDAGFVDGIANRFGDRVFGPKAMMDVFINEVVQPIGEEAVKPLFQEHITALARDVGDRAKRAWETGDIRELVRTGTPPTSSLPIVRYWWTQATPVEPVWQTDSRGVLLLANSEGRLYGMDSSTGALSYSADDVERLVAERGLHLVRRGPDPPWVDHVAVVVAPTADADDAGGWMSDFAAGLIARESIGAALDAGSARVKRWLDSMRNREK